MLLLLEPVAAPQKVTYGVRTGPSHPTPRETPQGNENTRPRENWYMDAHSSVIHSSQREKQPKHPSSGWICKMQYIHINGGLCAIKRNEMPIDAATRMDLENICSVRGADHEGPHTARFHSHETS